MNKLNKKQLNKKSLLFDWMEEYLDNIYEKMPSLSNFRKWVRTNKKVKGMADHISYIEVRTELFELQEEWLESIVAEGKRGSMVYLQLLKSLREKMNELRIDEPEEPAVVIKLDFKNDGKNSING